jgi:hypothetical protein
MQDDASSRFYIARSGRYLTALLPGNARPRTWRSSNAPIHPS